MCLSWFILSWCFLPSVLVFLWWVPYVLQDSPLLIYAISLLLRLVWLASDICCVIWKSVPMYSNLKYFPVLQQGVDVRYGNKGNKVKMNKCIEMKNASAKTEIKLKKCNALNSVFSRKVNCILLTILTQVTFQTKRSLNRIILKSGVLSYVWRMENA